MMKRRLVLSILLTVPFLLSGCLVISDLFSTQLDTIGSVRIDVGACFS